MAKKSYNEITEAEVIAAQKEVNKNERQITKAEKQRDQLRKDIDRLENKQYDLVKTLERVKKESAQLKKFIWTSDDPNIVILRDQLLLAAKLIKD